ncbi:helix-turn-helix domain-containing protein [Gandjariella thermophila]|uniref:helix-turn-helix domain-containing protein n=1 Tax=Gandjariella thermophila TaxID=1931992 RepID=UPI0010F69CA9
MIALVFSAGGTPVAISPTVRRRRLAAELHRLREAAGLTHQEVADRLGVGFSRAKSVIQSPYQPSR